jgi:hypothetical protein
MGFLKSFNNLAPLGPAIVSTKATLHTRMTLKNIRDPTGLILQTPFDKSTWTTTGHENKR